MGDGRIKLFIIERTLRFRNGARQLFEQGSYLPLAVEGSRADHVCAFARRLNGKEALVVAPRFFTRLIDGPGDLPHGAGPGGRRG